MNEIRPVEARFELFHRVTLRPLHLALLAGLLTLLAVFRIAATYPFTSQGYDEPGHIAAGMEWLDHGTYLIDPYHPPLSRVMMALPLYLAGERMPKNLPAPDPVHPDTAGNNSLSYTALGNAILYDSGHYLRNLSLARSGVLPFLVLATIAVFLWSRRQFGDSAGVFAVGLFTTLPFVLAFSGLAYTDAPAAALQFACMFVFVCWLQTPTVRWTVGLGLALGLAFLAKFTSLLFIPAAAVTIVLCKCWVERSSEPRGRVRWFRRATLALALALLVAWGGYRFSRGHIREAMHLSVDSVPSFQHFPAPLRNVGRTLVLSDPVLPAPAVLSGLAGAWVLNSSESSSYLFGRTRSGGFWYFFLAAVTLKTPIPFLILCAIGGWFSVRGARRTGRWELAAPAAATLALLLLSTRVHYDVGLRHFLLLFPFLAVLAGAGAICLSGLQHEKRIWGHVALVILLLWQTASSLRAGNDYLSYFNELAGKDPSRDLITGCDLDCGQDLVRLRSELQRRHATHVSLAVWTTAELDRMGLPRYDVLEPFQPVTGWVAVSARSLRLGDVLRKEYPVGSFAWLNEYRPVQQVGRTIQLYYIPDAGPVHAAKVTAPHRIGERGN